jgi:lipopolysaccharide export system protein LptA
MKTIFSTSIYIGINRAFFGLIVGLFLTISPGLAQVGRPPMRPMPAPGEQVEILFADSLLGLIQPGMVVRKLVGHVRMRQKGVLFFADLAIQNQTTNLIEAYGNVRIIQGDTVSVRGDTMYYYGSTRQANLRGRVLMKDRKMTLTTSQLDYDMVSGIAHYPNQGRIVDRENVLTSRVGFYDTRSKQFTFFEKVKLVNPKNTITTDSLYYNSLTRLSLFRGPTRIIGKDGVLVSREGQYNTDTKVSNFTRRATAETPRYTLTGDSLYYDTRTELGIAKGRAVLVSKEDRTIITGDVGRYNGQAGVSRVTGHATVRSAVGDRDTLYMRADTLFSFDDKIRKTRRLVGQKNVIVYKSDLQSKCDSIVYDVADSTIYFFKKPIVWSETYQMEADSMTAKLKNNRMHTMLLRSKSFVISQDTVLNFNQIKGRAITAYFKTIIDTLRPAPPKRVAGASKTAPPVRLPQPGQPAIAGSANSKPPQQQKRTTIDRVVVEGNGQSLYFAIEEPSQRIMGLNRVECSRMNLEFKASRVNRIRFYGRPDAQFVPPHEFTSDKKQLDGFRWRVSEKPTKAQALWQAEPVLAEPVKPRARPLRPQDKPLTKNTAALKPLPVGGVPSNKK